MNGSRCKGFLPMENDKTTQHTRWCLPEIDLGSRASGWPNIRASGETDCPSAKSCLVARRRSLWMVWHVRDMVATCGLSIPPSLYPTLLPSRITQIAAHVPYHTSSIAVHRAHSCCPRTCWNLCGRGVCMREDEARTGTIINDAVALADERRPTKP